MVMRGWTCSHPIRICPIHVCRDTYPIHAPRRFEGMPDDAQPGKAGSASQGGRTSTSHFGNASVVFYLELVGHRTPPASCPCIDVVTRVRFPILSDCCIMYSHTDPSPARARFALNTDPMPCSTVLLQQAIGFERCRVPSSFLLCRWSS